MMWPEAIATRFSLDQAMEFGYDGEATRVLACQWEAIAHTWKQEQEISCWLYSTGEPWLYLGHYQRHKGMWRLLRAWIQDQVRGPRGRDPVDSPPRGSRLQYGGFNCCQWWGSAARFLGSAEDEPDEGDVVFYKTPKGVSRRMSRGLRNPRAAAVKRVDEVGYEQVEVTGKRGTEQVERTRRRKSHRRANRDERFRQATPTRRKTMTRSGGRSEGPNWRKVLFRDKGRKKFIDAQIYNLTNLLPRTR